MAVLDYSNVSVRRRRRSYRWCWGVLSLLIFGGLTAAQWELCHEKNATGAGFVALLLTFYVCPVGLLFGTIGLTAHSRLWWLGLAGILLHGGTLVAFRYFGYTWMFSLH